MGWKLLVCVQRDPVARTRPGPGPGPQPGECSGAGGSGEAVSSLHLPTPQLDGTLSAPPASTGPPPLPLPPAPPLPPPPLLFFLLIGGSWGFVSLMKKQTASVVEGRDVGVRGCLKLAMGRVLAFKGFFYDILLA